MMRSFNCEIEECTNIHNTKFPTHCILSVKPVDEIFIPIAIVTDYFGPFDFYKSSENNSENSFLQIHIFFLKYVYV